MSRERMCCIVLLSIMCSLTYAADSSPPKIVYLWHGGMSSNYGYQPVSNYAIDDRSPALFKCNASGIPEPILIWTKDGIKITGDTRTTLSESGQILTISNPTKEDNGVYQCNASSSIGTALSQEITAGLAFIDNSFSNLDTNVYEVQPNDMVEIPCNQPPSFPEPEISWAKSLDVTSKIVEKVLYSSRISLSPSGSLIFGNVVDESDEGFYICQVNNLVLSKIKDSPFRRLQISGMPTGPRDPTWVSLPPSPVLAIAGTNMSLKCVSDGFPTPDIVWENLKESDRYKRASFGQEVIISGVTRDDAGSFQCRAVSAIEITHAFELVVEAAPSWVNEPADVGIAPEETGTITCEATGIPEPEITWLKNGEQILLDSHITIDGNSITITDATRDDNSVYQCIATNKHGKIMADALLSVNIVGAEIVNGPDVDKPAAEGDSVTLACDHVGRPLPTVTWHGKSGQIINDEKYTINEDGSLTISNVVKEDEGVYTCRVSNQGSNDDASGSIVFRRKTTITQGVATTSVVKPKAVILTCDAEADAKAEVVWSWIANGTPVNDVTRDRFNPNRNELEILKTKVLDTGEYCCIVETTFDSAISCANLIVQDVPSAPYNVEAVKVQDYSATVSWVPSNSKNAPVIEYIIEYNTTYVDIPWKRIATTTGTSVDVTLSGGITYHFRVTAVNSVGQSVPSEGSNSIATQAGAPTMNPTDVVGQSDDPNTMVISWTLMDVTQYGGSGFMYKVEYRRSLTIGESETVWLDQDIDRDVNSVTVDDTGVYQAFEIKVSTVNDVGPGPESELVIGHSGEGTPQTAPDDINVDVLSPTSVTVSFAAVPPVFLNGIFKYYRIYFNAAATQVTHLKYKDCLETSCRLDNLSPSTDYELYVVVANSKKEGPASETQRFSTPEAPPGIPVNFQIVMLSKKMQLSWVAPSGNVDYYKVLYTPWIDDKLGNSTDAYPGSDDRTVVIDHLTPETTYTVSIKGRNSAGYGIPAVIQIETRIVGIPNIPEDPVVALGKEDAIITFTKDNVGPAVEKYLVQYRKAGAEDTEWMTVEVHAFEQKTETLLPDLAPTTKYEVKLVAMNEDGQGKEGNTITFTTAGTGAATSGDGFQVQPWLIIMVCIIVLLLVILLILCYVRSQKGGKYNVSDKEDKLRGDPESAPLKDDEGGFEEYKPKGPENSKPLPDPEDDETSDEDSLAGYAEGNTGNFDEDGSFIGQYSDKRKKAEEEGNQAMQSLV